MSEESKRERSPNYPYIGLKQASEHIATLFKSAGRSRFHIDGAVKAMGFSSVNGTSKMAVAALVNYGLVEKIGDEYALSPSAMQILHPTPEKPAEEAIREAALRPKVFRNIFEKYHDCSVELLTSRLIHDGFTSEGAAKVAKMYKANAEFAKLDELGYISPDSGSKEPELPMQPASQTQSPPPSQQQPLGTPAAPSALMDIPVPLPSGVTAYFRIPASMSEADFGVYRTVLGAYKQALVREGSSSGSAQRFPVNAIWRNKDSDKPVVITGEMGKTTDGETFYRSQDGSGIPGSQLDFNALLPSED